MTKKQKKYNKKKSIVFKCYNRHRNNIQNEK